MGNMAVQRSREKKGGAPRFLFDRIQLAAIAVTTFALPLLMWPGLTDYNYAKSAASLILISVLLALWGVNAWQRASWTIYVPWPLVPVFGFVLAGVLSLIQATNGRVVMQSLILLICFVLLLWMIANVVRDQRDVRWLLAALLASGTLAALYGVLQYFGVVPGSPGEMGVNAILSSMGNRNHLGGFLLYLLYPGGILLLKARMWWARMLVALLLVALLAAMLLLRQAGTQVALALVTGLLVVGWLIFRVARRLRAGRRRLLALAAVVVAVSACALIVTTVMISLTDRANEKPWLVNMWEANSGKTRAWDWWIGAEMFAEHPVTGVGLGNYKLEFIPSKADFLATERGQAYDFYIPRAAQAHNEYVQVGAELGVVGLFMLFASLGTLGVALWIRSKRARDRSARLDLLLLTTGILAFLAHSVVSFPAHVVGSSLELVVFCGLALSLAYGKSMSFAWVLDGWKGKGFHVLLIAVGLAVSLFASADMRANWLMERGIDQVQAGLFASGEATLRRSLALDFAPIAQIQLGDLEEAEASLEQCMTRFIDEASLLNYANLLVNTGQLERASAPLDLLVSSHPRLEIQTRARYLQALVASEMGDPEKAILLIEELLASDRNYETAYIGLGGIFESLQRFGDARTTYETGFEIIEKMLADTRKAIDVAGDAITAERYGELRGRIDKLTYERATIIERLRELPEPVTP